MIGRLRAPGPHDGQPVLAAGVSLEAARTAMILVHGRGDTASGILQLARAVPRPDMSYVAPQAAANTWYPNRFLAPIASNEPWLSSALDALADLMGQVEAGGIPSDRIVVLGFSQGACLALEFAVRHPRRYGGLVGLSGGLIGPPGTTWTPPASFAGTPVYLGCSDEDGHIPAARVQETAEVFSRFGGEVTAILYPGMDHAITEDELVHVRRIVAAVPA